mgnify:CR=1 FL=1
MSQENEFDDINIVDDDGDSIELDIGDDSDENQNEEDYDTESEPNYGDSEPRQDNNETERFNDKSKKVKKPLSDKEKRSLDSKFGFSSMSEKKKFIIFASAFSAIVMGLGVFYFLNMQQQPTRMVTPPPKQAAVPKTSNIIADDVDVNRGDVGQGAQNQGQISYNERSQSNNGGVNTEFKNNNQFNQNDQSNQSSQNYSENNRNSKVSVGDSQIVDKIDKIDKKTDVIFSSNENELKKINNTLLSLNSEVAIVKEASRQIFSKVSNLNLASNNESSNNEKNGNKKEYQKEIDRLNQKISTLEKRNYDLNNEKMKLNSELVRLRVDYRNQSDVLNKTYSRVKYYKSKKAPEVKKTYVQCNDSSSNSKNRNIDLSKYWEIKGMSEDVVFVQNKSNKEVLSKRVGESFGGAEILSIDTNTGVIKTSDGFLKFNQ